MVNGERLKNLSPFTKPTILQWPVSCEKKLYQGKERDISRCFRLGSLEMMARQGKEGKDSKERIVNKGWQGYDVKGPGGMKIFENSPQKWPKTHSQKLLLLL